MVSSFWSRRRGSNPRPQRPERCALPAALRLVIRRPLALKRKHYNKYESKSQLFTQANENYFRIFSPCVFLWAKTRAFPLCTPQILPFYPAASPPSEYLRTRTNRYSPPPPPTHTIYAA